MPRPPQPRHRLLWLSTLLALTLAVGLLPAPAAARWDGGRPGDPAGTRGSTGQPVPTYTNPLPLELPDGDLSESCADPALMRSKEPGDDHWYLYCTTDPFSGDDRDADGNLIFHLVPIFKSLDMVHWTYVDDAFTTRPEWMADDAGIWAPFVDFHDGTYFLYYTAPETEAGGSAIGVATAPTPAGPWTHHGEPVVAPRPDPSNPGAYFWTFDPETVTGPDGTRYLFFGSYYGGMFARKLTDDGLGTDPATEKRIAIGNRYEAADVHQRNGWYYLFASATNCCNGPLTGYSVFVGRSRDPLGPYRDREGVSFLNGRVGGTPVISMNGNRWVGPGHSQVVEDAAGQTWLYYHAIDRFDPYFEGAVGFTKRPVLLDRLDWIGGWPTVRGGQWASDGPQRGPVAQDDQREPRRWVRLELPHRPGRQLHRFSTSFDGERLERAWSWVREPAASTYEVADGRLSWDTQAVDLHTDSNSASVLLRAAPRRARWVVETKVKLDLPPEGCCQNFVQAGLVVYDDDDNYLKLVHVSIFETRQTEFAKEWFPVPDGWPRYGNTVVGAPGEWTWLRVVKERHRGEEHYTAYTSDDGRSWVRGGTWTHELGDDVRIGLVSMGGSGFTADFDYVRVHQLRGGWRLR